MLLEIKKSSSSDSDLRKIKKEFENLDYNFVGAMRIGLNGVDLKFYEQNSNGSDNIKHCQWRINGNIHWFN